MKKSYLALSLLAASTSAAWAQTSSVTLYGIVDAGVTYTSGVRGGNVTQLVSGIMDGSRLGVRGTEDLGGGFSAGFTLENRLEADTGGTNNRPVSGSQLPDRMTQAALFVPGFSAFPPANQAAIQGAVTKVAGALGPSFGVNVANNFWDRQAFVRLVTPIGAVSAGRQYTPAYLMQAEFDIMQTQSSLAAGQVASFPSAIDIRQSNSVQYGIQTGGFTAAAMVAAGEGSTSQGHFMGLMSYYRSDAFTVGFGYQERENESGQKSLKNLVVGASAAIGPGKLSAMYVTAKDENPSGLSSIRPLLISGGASAGAASLVANAFINAFRQDSVLMHIGYKMTMGANTFYTAYSKLNDKTKFDADTQSYGVAYTYAFSKRTDVNAVLTHFDNKGLGQMAPGGAGFLGGVTTSAGTDSNSFGVGLRHRF
ncbi:porin [Paucibacter sp. B2R-40]|uniref:porin n=1 Tax=Paucibacter sp. B2R-40 TaxID=2893554 RepID=UPI0021E3732D|nr:porin [Paucibacter sp. B2R-40]MCV2356174.1 porin [Paucibacter sp. B2R-40]